MILAQSASAGVPIRHALRTMALPGLGSALGSFGQLMVPGRRPGTSGCALVFIDPTLCPPLGMDGHAAIAAQVLASHQGQPRTVGRARKLRPGLDRGPPSDADIRGLATPLRAHLPAKGEGEQDASRRHLLSTRRHNLRQIITP